MASLWFKCYKDGEGYCYRKGVYTECRSCDKAKNCEKRKSESKDGVCHHCTTKERNRKRSKPPKGV